MIRDRLKKAARKAAIKVLKMDFDTQGGIPPSEGIPTPSMPSKIPTVVAGSGDTPGPNHKHDIGRTWTAAQVAGGAGNFFLDIRPPQEAVTGVLPGAIVMPGDLIKEHLDILPEKTDRVTVLRPDRRPRISGTRRVAPGAGLGLGPTPERRLRRVDRA